MSFSYVLATCIFSRRSRSLAGLQKHIRVAILRVHVLVVQCLCLAVFLLRWCLASSFHHVCINRYVWSWDFLWSGSRKMHFWITSWVRYSMSFSYVLATCIFSRRSRSLAGLQKHIRVAILRVHVLVVQCLCLAVFLLRWCLASNFHHVCTNRYVWSWDFLWSTLTIKKFEILWWGFRHLGGTCI